MKKKQKFTLIEILTVIAIIGILAAFIFPALFAVQNNSRRTKTETILTSVNTAIKVYKGDYNILPTIDGSVKGRIGEWSGDINNMKPSDDYYTFFDILSYKNHKGGSSVTSVVENSNPKAVQYLDPPKDYFHKDYRLNSIRDAWNRPIVVFLDKTGDGNIDNDDDNALKEYTDASEFPSESVALSMGNQDDGINYSDAERVHRIISK